MQVFCISEWVTDCTGLCQPEGQDDSGKWLCHPHWQQTAAGRSMSNMQSSGWCRRSCSQSSSSRSCSSAAYSMASTTLTMCNPSCPCIAGAPLTKYTKTYTTIVRLIPTACDLHSNACPIVSLSSNPPVCCLGWHRGNRRDVGLVVCPYLRDLAVNAITKDGQNDSPALHEPRGPAAEPQRRCCCEKPRNPCRMRHRTNEARPQSKTATAYDMLLGLLTDPPIFAPLHSSRHATCKKPR